MQFNNNNTGNISNILDVIRKENPDVIVIQEFQTKYCQLIRGIKNLSYKFSFCNENPTKTLRNRVLIASKEPFKTINAPQKICSYSSRNWREIIVKSSFPIHILGVHVPLATTTNIGGLVKDNRKEKKIFLFGLLEKFIEYSNSNEPSIICGDLNLHKDAIYYEFLEEFHKYLIEVTTKEPTHANHKFDYIFVNNAFKDLINPQEIFAPNPTHYSDHSYLYVETI